MYAVLQKLSSNNLNCLQYHFGTILTIFSKFKYYFDFDKSAITLQPSKNKEACPIPSSLKSIAYFSFFGVRNLKAVEGFSIFFRTNIFIVCYFSI